MSVQAWPTVRGRLRADPLRWLLAAIAVATVLSGVAQLVAPGLVLGILDAESTAATRHFFAIVGMFMAVVGGLTVQALVADTTPTYVIAWAGVQKFGAFLAVTLGVARDVFGVLALPVAAFDLLTAVICVLLWRRLRTAATAGNRGTR